jgi:geranylgeranyl pyrophosphate synthase
LVSASTIDGDIGGPLTQHVLAGLAEVMPGLAVSAAQRAQFTQLVERMHEAFKDDDERNLVCTQVPTLVAHGLGAPPAAVRAVAMVCTIVYGAARLIDDVMDGEIEGRVPPDGRDVDPFVLATALGAAAYRLVTMIDVPAVCRLELVEELSRMLLRMAAGQTADVAQFGSLPAVETVLASIAAKSGAMVGGFASCGAIVAEADEPTRSACAAFGANLGAARQIAADLHELATDRTVDAANLAATLPITIHARGLDDSARTSFLVLYADSARSADARCALVHELHRSGAWTESVLHLDVALSRAVIELENLRLGPQHRSRLRALVDFTNPPTTR